MTVEKTCGPNSRPLDKIVIHQDTLWMRCFWVVAKRNRDEGREVVKFCDVDDLVLEKSKLPISDLQAWLMDNAELRRGRENV